MNVCERTPVTIALLLFAAVCCVLAANFTGDAGLLPLTAGFTVVLSCALQLVFDRNTQQDPPEWSGRDAFFSAFALLGGLYLLGFFIALPLYAGLAWKRSGANWRAAAVTAGSVLLVTYVGFYLLLNIDLYGGVLWRAVSPR